MNKKNWETFVEKINQTIEGNPDLDEANTKSRIISPLLQNLGWNPLEGEVRAEYPIQFATSTSHVDYALLVKGSPAVFVEAKALRSDLNPAHAKQLIDYGRHKGVNWCVLTNGKELRIYNSEWLNPEEDNTQDALVETITTDEFVDKFDLLEKISKESMVSGEGPKQAFRRIKQTRDTIRSLEDNREDIETELQEVINKYSGELVQDKINTATTKFVGGLIEELSVYPGTTPPESQRTENEPTAQHPEDIQLPVKSRSQISEEYPDGTVMITPTSPDLVDDETDLPVGVGFFKTYSSWGFVRVGPDRDIDYLALYVSSPVSAVLYFGKVVDIVNPRSSKSPVKRHVEQKEDLASWNLEEGKKVLILDKDSLVELEDPIELGTVPKGVIQGKWYTTLDKFVKAEVTDDLKCSN